MSNKISTFIKLGVLVITFAVNSAWASGSFRLDNGKLIYSGMSKTELMNVAGSPMSSETIPKITFHLDVHVSLISLYLVT